MDPTETAEASQPDLLADDAPLSAHEQVYSPDAPEGLSEDDKKTTDEARARVRHRASSQQATPDDVAEISTLTARIKALEDAGGIERKPNESERVFRLRARAELLERTLTPPKPVERPVERPQPLQRVAPQPDPNAPKIEPTRAKPLIEDVGTKYKDWDEYQEDIIEWKVEQREHAAKIARERDEATTNYNARKAEWDKDHDTMATRVAAFKATHPDYDALLAANATDVPPAVYQAILKHDNGPALVYHLVSHPDDLTDAVLMFDGKPLTSQIVALATRWLNSRAKVESTGTTAPEPLKPGPRPPNPVRTGPTKASDALPDDDSPLSAHEARFMPKNR